MLVKPKISKLSHIPTTSFISYIFKIKSVLKHSQNEAILISNDLIVPQLHLSRQKCAKDMSDINLI